MVGPGPLGRRIPNDFEPRVFRIASGLVHTTNEDSFAVREMNDGGTLLLVCDGMGGMGQGDVASRLAVEHILGHLESGHGDPTERMRDAIVNRIESFVKNSAIRVKGTGSTTVDLCTRWYRLRLLMSRVLDRDGEVLSVHGTIS